MNNPIYGIPMVTPLKRPDLRQTDPSKGDYVLGREMLFDNATPIVGVVTGETISVADASDHQLYGLTIYGNTAQNGTPAPAAPVSLVSAGNRGSIAVAVSGAEVEQTISVPTPDGLPGIPVDGGWIADEIDLGRGVYVQRVNKIVLTGAENWLIANTKNDVNILYLNAAYPVSAADNGYCTHFRYSGEKAYAGNSGYIGTKYTSTTGKDRLWVATTMTAAEFKTFLAENPVTMLYPMAEPAEIALEDDLIAEFSRLHSYKPNTTVTNDAGAEMKLEYVADTKTYVDNHGGNGGNGDLTGYATEQWVQQGFQPKGEYLTKVPEGYAKTEDIPTKPEDIGAQPAGNYATVDQLPDVPVQSVNGKTGAVNLSASDVKARPENWMPTVQDVGALPSSYIPPNQTAEQVGADPKGTAAAAVSQHNTAENSHNDIRLELKAINERLTAFFDSDDQTLDELSEIVAYITSNKSLIDAVTTSKVNVADIINNLTTNVSNKPLSAAQGVVLKGLIDTLTGNLSSYQPKGDYALASQIPTKVSQLQNDSGFLNKHQDISGLLPRTELPTAVNDALAQAAASGAFDGKDGRGIKSITRTAGNGAAGTTDTYTITYTDNTTSTLTVYNGKNGTNGTSVTVKAVSESTADGGSNVITFSDGTELTVKNGKAGTPGKTPVYGVDYGTPAQIEEIVQQVITALGMPVFGTVDLNKVITLKTDSLADGTYKIGYNDKDGKFVEIGIYEKGESYTNLADPSSADWLTNKRLNSSGVVTDTTPSLTTNYIPVKMGDVVRVRYMNIRHQGSGTSNATTHFYNASKTRVALITPANMGTNELFNDADGLGVMFNMTTIASKISFVSGYASADIAFVRFSGKLYDGYTKDDVIITVNEEITD